MVEPWATYIAVAETRLWGLRSSMPVRKCADEVMMLVARAMSASISVVGLVAQCWRAWLAHWHAVAAASCWSVPPVIQVQSCCKSRWLNCSEDPAVVIKSRLTLKCVSEAGPASAGDFFTNSVKHH